MANDWERERESEKEREIEGTCENEKSWLCTLERKKGRHGEREDKTLGRGEWVTLQSMQLSHVTKSTYNLTIIR